MEGFLLRISEQPGCGGMGEVYFAGDVPLDRKVALKFPITVTGPQPRYCQNSVKSHHQAAYNKRFMKNVLFITYYFPPAGGPGVQRVTKHVKYLRDFGYNPIVLTASPKDYSGRSELNMVIDDSLKADIPEGMEVHRIRSHQPFRLFQLLHKLRLEYLRELFFIPDSAITWIIPVLLRARRIAREQQIDLIYTSVKPHSAAITGWLLKRILKKPWIIDFRDPWTQYFLARYPTKAHYRIEQFLERFLLRRADHVITITPTARKNLMTWCSFLKEDALSYITNGYDPEDFGSHSKAPKKDGLPFTLAYSGVFCGAPETTLDASRTSVERLWRGLRKSLAYKPRSFDSLTHSPKFLLDAIRELLLERPELRGRIKLVHVGPYDEANDRYVQDLGIREAIDARGYVPHSQAVRTLEQSDALFFCLADSPSQMDRNDCVPQKVYEYLGSRQPVLALTPEGDAKDFFREAGTAVICAPRDIPAIKSALIDFFEGKVRITRNEEFIRSFERRRMTEKLAQIFNRILSSCGEAKAG
jgi:glycosyltransferase involved in cell wall biosynthesis